MPSLTKGRVRPLSGEVYFVNPEGVGTFISQGAIDGPYDLEGLPVDYGLYPTSNSLNDVLTHSTVKGVSYLAAPSVLSIITNDSGPFHTTDTVIPGPLIDVALVQSESSRMLVGHPIMIYQVPQIVRLTYPASGNFQGYFMDNYPLNRTDFRLVRGVQNEINFYVRDVDRKPVALGMTETLTINITDAATNTLLMSRNMTTIDASQGIYLFTTYPSEMELWPTQPANWSVTYNRADGSSVLLWTDRIYSPYSTCTITRGPVPGPAPTVTVLYSQFVLQSDSYYYGPALPGSALHGFQGGVQSFFFNFVDFTGIVRFDASLATNPVDDYLSTDWFEVDLKTFTDQNGTLLVNEVGNYLWMRLVLLPPLTGSFSFEYKS